MLKNILALRRYICYRWLIKEIRQGNSLSWWAEGFQHQIRHGKKVIGEISSALSINFLSSCQRENRPGNLCRPHRVYFRRINWKKRLVTISFVTSWHLGMLLFASSTWVTINLIICGSFWQIPHLLWQSFADVDKRKETRCQCDNEIRLSVCQISIIVSYS